MTRIDEIKKRHGALQIDVRQMKVDIEYLLNEVRWRDREWTKDSDEVIRLRIALGEATKDTKR